MYKYTQRVIGTEREESASRVQIPVYKFYSKLAASLRGRKL